MKRILFIGQKPETVDFSDPALPPGFDAAKINAGMPSLFRPLKSGAYPDRASVAQPKI